MAKTPFDPEAVEVALFNLLVNALKAGNMRFVEFSRQRKIVENVDIAQRPAFYLSPLRIITTQPNVFGPPIYRVEYMAQVLGWDEHQQNAVPQTFLNRAFFLISQAMLNQLPGQKQDLGGLVENAWIEGSSEFATGIVPTDEVQLLIPMTAITGL